MKTRFKIVIFTFRIFINRSMNCKKQKLIVYNADAFLFYNILIALIH